jgi:DNA (cytosine-5)-methyltransferase 1
LFLENVDRLLKSPASQRGRDFAVMLKSLNDLGYAIEWRVINAGEYGMPQRRRRTFIVGYHKSSDIYKRILKSKKIDWIQEKGTIANAFPLKEINKHQEFEIRESLEEITTNFNKEGKLSPFQNTGLLFKGKVYTAKTIPKYNGRKIVLGDVLQNGEVTDDFFIKDSNLKTPKSILEKDGTEKTITTEKEMWEYLKGSKSILRVSKDGFKYNYSEGGMIYPDALDNASRTIITGEGGKSPSRFKHVIVSERGLRRLTPVELERLNMFPDNHTKMEGVTDTKRAFFMGNALVVGVIEKIGDELYKQINE